jgi:hypothetical protein
MTATYPYAGWEIEIEFRIFPGERMTHDYPGSPPEVDWIKFTCPANPAKAKKFETMARCDNDLAHAIDQACLDHAEAMYELSQCDD